MSPFIVLTCCIKSIQVLETAELRTDEDVKNVVEVTWMLNKFSTNEHYPRMAKVLFLILEEVQDVVFLVCMSLPECPLSQLWGGR